MLNAYLYSGVIYNLEEIKFMNAYLYSGVIYNLEEIKFMLNLVPVL